MLLMILVCTSTRAIQLANAHEGIAIEFQECQTYHVDADLLVFLYFAQLLYEGS